MAIPAPSFGDRSRGLILAAVSEIPLPGAAALSTVLGWYLPSPYQKRLDAFFTDVANRLERLEKAGTLDPATLEHNDAFLDAVRAAIDQAARTADAEKHEALASAVIYLALTAVPGELQAQLRRALEDIDELSDADGSLAMAEQLVRAQPNLVGQFNAIAGHASRAMWVYLNHPATFRVAASLAEAAHLARGRSWVKRSGLPVPADPAVPFVYTDEMAGRLVEAIEAFHKPEVRGEGCKVRHIARGNGSEYFFVTMNDYSHVVPVWRDGEVVDALGFSEFGHTFVYTPAAGTLEIHAKGGKRVNGPLHRIFGKAVLDIDLPITAPIKPSYTLDHLMKRDRKLECDSLDPVRAPRLTRLVLGSKDHDCEPITVEANPELGPKRIDEVLDRLLREEVRGPEHWTVLAARFHLDLKPEAKKRHPTMQFSVTRHSCDLRSRPDEVRAWGERTMQRSGVSFG